MKKPESPRVEPPGRLDTDLSERIIRALQDSALHVCQLLCQAGDPSQPDQPNAYIILTLTCVTDGARGFLVIADDFAPPESDRHLAEFMTSLYRDEPCGDDYAIALGKAHDGEAATEGLLDMRDPTRARDIVETAYAATFAGKSPVDHDGFLEQFRRFGFTCHDERECREWCAGLDSIGYPADRDSIVPTGS